MTWQINAKTAAWFAGLIAVWVLSSCIAPPGLTTEPKSDASAPSSGTAQAMAAVQGFLDRYGLEAHPIQFVSTATDIQHWPLARAAERYAAGAYSIVVDAQTGVVLEFAVDETPSALAYTPRLDDATLETRAREIIFAEAGVKTDALQLEKGVKGDVGKDAHYFFRWWGEASPEPPAAEESILCGEGVNEDADGVFTDENGIPCIKLPAGQRPYIQVGLTEGGQLLNFVNAGLYATLTALQETPKPTTIPQTTMPPAPTDSGQGQRIASPDGQWVAVLDAAVGRLDLVGSDGTTHTPFPTGSSAWSAEWSPDSTTLLVVLSSWEPPQENVIVNDVNGQPELWAVSLSGRTVGEPQRLFRLEDDDVVARSGGGRVEVVFGAWSPTGRAIVFWAGGGAAMRADGNAPFVLDATTGKAIRIADWALVNPAYHSWSPDGAALAMTMGGGRSAQANKWLNLVDLDSGTVSTVISKSEQIPGIVAWSPQGDRIAYAAVEAGPPSAYENDDHCCPMTFANPAIAGRRIYLLDPATGDYWRLNSLDTFQDAPIWSDDGTMLYYVERHDDTIALMAADPNTGDAQVVTGSERPLPEAVGYYGQSNWEELLAYVPHGAQETNSQPQPLTLLMVWDIAQEYAHAWSEDASLIILNSADVDDLDQAQREDGSRRVWQAVYTSSSLARELHIQIVDGEVRRASEEGIYDSGVPTVTEKPQIDSPAALQSVQVAIPDFGFSIGRGRGFHFSLHSDSNGRVVITVVGSSQSLEGNQVPISVTLDPATGQVLERQVLPQ